MSYREKDVLREDVSLLMCVIRDLACILVLRWCVVNDARFVAQLNVYYTVHM